MNLLLLDPEAVSPQGTATITGSRAAHLRQVLGVLPGSVVRAGVLNESRGRASIEAVAADSVSLRYSAEAPCPSLPPRVLLLGMPRPKAFSRCLQHAAALGFTRILVLGCQRVEKGHLRSGRLDSARLHEDLVLGLEQGSHVLLPEVSVFARFKPFVQDSLDALVPKAGRFVAHLGAPLLRDLALAPTGSRYALAIGPDGGFVPYEVELLRACGFLPFGSDAGALRVESALSYFTGQLDAVLGTGPV
jgi:RsmE family RNA methyltransferase